MTHRAIWSEPGCWWPDHRDFPDATTAHAFALTKSTQIRDEVTVHELPTTAQEATP